jgi:hypothetical protein
VKNDLKINPTDLYRGVSIKLVEQGLALKPHAPLDSPFHGYFRTGLGSIGDSIGASIKNAVKEHQRSSSWYKHGVLSTSSCINIAKNYALGEDGEGAGYILKFLTSKLDKLQIINAQISCYKLQNKEFLLKISDMLINSHKVNLNQFFEQQLLISLEEILYTNSPDGNLLRINPLLKYLEALIVSLGIFKRKL